MELHSISAEDGIVMFRDIRCRAALEVDSGLILNFEYELIDTDFGSVKYFRPIVDKQNPLIVRVQIVIDEYSKRGLNVGMNLLLLLNHWEKKFPSGSGFECKLQSLKHILTDEMLRDIEKYAVLL